MSTPELVTPEWTVTDRLAKARRVAGLSQQDLAEHLDMNIRTINRYETGYPTKRTVLLAWALACGVDPVWLEKGEPVTSSVTLWEQSERPIQFAA
jgi:transcriptional regulator with XRE-family HTH domain